MEMGYIAEGFTAAFERNSTSAVGDTGLCHNSPRMVEFESDCERTGNHGTCIAFIGIFSVAAIILFVLLIALCLIRKKQQRIRQSSFKMSIPSEVAGKTDDGGAAGQSFAGIKPLRQSTLVPSKVKNRQSRSLIETSPTNKDTMLGMQRQNTTSVSKIANVETTEQEEPSSSSSSSSDDDRLNNRLAEDGQYGLGGICRSFESTQDRSFFMWIMLLIFASLVCRVVFFLIIFINGSS